jgi:hypothetical protein
MIVFMALLLPQLPVLAILSLAVIFAIMRYAQHPQVSILIVAFALLELALLAAGIGINLYLPSALTEAGYRPGDLAMTFAIIGIVRSVLHALALGLIVWAALGWRTEAPLD